MTRYRFATRILAFSMFVQGACGLIYEYTLGALGNHLIGTSHEQIFVVIGIMMFSMGLGSVVQQALRHHLIDRWLLLEILLGLVGGISVIAIYATFSYTASYRVVMYLFAVLVGVLIGVEIPLLIRINQEYASSLRANLSSVLFMDYAGSLAGALLFAYVLLTRFALFNVTLALGVVNASLGLLGVLYFWPLLHRPWRLLIAGGVTIGALIVLMLQASPLMNLFEQRTFADPIILSESTDYQHLVLTKRDDRLNLYINGHLQFSSRDEQIYHEMLVHPPMVLARAHQRVLILGGGDGLALREVLDYPKVREVLLVDLDERMTELAATKPELVRLNEGAFRDARTVEVEAGGLRVEGRREIWRDATEPHKLRNKSRHPIAEVGVLNIDADLFLRNVDGLFDVIIVDFPDPSSVEVAKLYSRSFYSSLAAHLAPGGCVAIQSTSPYHAREVFLCIGETLRAAGLRILRYHQNVPSFGEWGWHLAWRGGADETALRSRISRLESFPVETDYITPELLHASLSFGRGVLAGEQIKANTRMRPVILAYHRNSWKD